MAQKRQPEDRKVVSEASSPEEKRQRVPALRNVILDVMKMHKCQKFLSAFEPVVRKVVKEEVEVALKKHMSSVKQSCSNQIHPLVSRSLQLQFINRLSLPIFTGAQIEGEEGSLIKVALVDTLTAQVANSGPGSSAKVEIVVLEGDFEGDQEGSWAHEEFNSNIVRERGGKGPLLIGDVFLNLNEGTGLVGDLVFTDNSSWTRSRRFRLGARIADGSCDGIRIREAKTEPFMVKDHRGELYKKHYPPSLGDEVWRLEKIGKDGAFHKRLIKENIKTVKDFLTLLSIDAPRLRSILGTGMSAKMWEVTVDHAKTCTLEKRMYLYCPPASKRTTGVVFNVVGQVLGLHTGSRYVSVDDFSETEKDHACKLVKAAYEHWDDVVSGDDETVMFGSLCLPDVSLPTGSPRMESPHGSRLNFHQSIEVSSTHASTSSPDIVSPNLSISNLGNLDEYATHDIENIALGYDHTFSFPSLFTNPQVCGVDSMTETFSIEDRLHYFDPETPFQTPNLGSDSQSDLHTVVSGFLAMSARSAAAAAASNKARTRWTMLFSVLKWRFLIRRILASKKGARRKMDRYS